MRLSTLLFAALLTFVGAVPASAQFCPPGSFGPSGQAPCTPCSAGFFNPVVGQTFCSACPGGTFSSTGSASCTNCPAGTFSLPGSASCTPCPGGFFSPAP